MATEVVRPELDQTIYVIDRFEDNDFVVLERRDGQSFPIPSAWLPSTAQEGDVLRIHSFSASSADRLILLLERDDQVKAEKLEAVSQLRAALPRGPEGDFSL